MTRRPGLGLLALAFGHVPVPVGAAPVTQVGAYVFSMPASGGAVQVHYDANLPLTGIYPQIERAVVLLHGSSRSSRNASDNLRDAAQIAGADDGTSLLVAPQLLIEEDVAFHGLPAAELFWSESGWKEGDQSLSTTAHPRPVQLSSFAVLDSILARIALRAPNLNSIVFAGHSAGGQFVQRFAAGSPTRAALASTYGVDLSFVVANPSSYLYLDAQRAVPPSWNQFAVPSAATQQACPDWDDYKYGLRSRNTYMSVPSSATIVARYREARVAVLLGEQDDDPGAVDLDTSCEAELQGATRLERGRIYDFATRRLFGAGIAATHTTFVVPDVGHSAPDIFTSPCGVAALFGGGGCDPVDVQRGDAAARSVALASTANPFRVRTTLRYRVPAGSGSATLRIHDLRGRLVRILACHPGPDGRGEVVWDGTSASGERLPAGVYFLRLRAPAAGTATARVTLLR